MRGFRTLLRQREGRGDDDEGFDDDDDDETDFERKVVMLDDDDDAVLPPSPPRSPRRAHAFEGLDEPGNDCDKLLDFYLCLCDAKERPGVHNPTAEYEPFERFEHDMKSTIREATSPPRGAKAASER